MLDKSEKVKILHTLIDDALDRNQFVKATFIKKDNSVREMCLHRSKKLEATVNGMHPLITSKANETLHANGMMRVEEFCRDENGNPIHQWRTLNLGTIQRLAINGAVLDFTK